MQPFNTNGNIKKKDYQVNYVATNKVTCLNIYEFMQPSQMLNVQNFNVHLDNLMSEEEHKNSKKSLSLSVFFFFFLTFYH